MKPSEGIARKPLSRSGPQTRSSDIAMTSEIELVCEPCKIKYTYKAAETLPEAEEFLCGKCSSPLKALKNSEPEITKSEKVKSGESSSSVMLFLVLLTVSLVVLLIAFWYQKSDTDSPRITDQPVDMHVKQEKLLREIDDIIREMSNTNSNLKSVNKTLSIFVKENVHEKPRIILLMGTKNSWCQVCCFLRKMVKALAGYYSEDFPTDGYIEASDLIDKDDKAKVFIANSIEKALTKDKKHFIVMQDLDRFPISTLSIVHSYLDPDLAPHKEALFFLTAVMDVDKDLSPGELVQAHFDERWAGYDEEHRRALMGRFYSVVGLVHRVTVNQDDDDGDSLKSGVQNMGGKCENSCRCRN